MKLLESLDTPRTRIRRFQPGDRQHFVQFMTNGKITENLSLYDDSKSERGAIELLNYAIQSYRSKDPIYAYAIEDAQSGQWVGACGMNPRNKQIIEVFYALLPEAWGKGLGTEVLQGLTAHIFRDGDFQEIHAFIRQENESSKGVAIKAGYENVGLVDNPSFDEKVYLFSIDRSRYESMKQKGE